MKQKKYFTIIILETWSNVFDVIVSRVGRDGNFFTCRLDDAVVGLLLPVRFRLTDSLC